MASTMWGGGPAHHQVPLLHYHWTGNRARTTAASGRPAVAAATAHNGAATANPVACPATKRK
eukprot:10189503-Lingulodinium_polyedra.AAC.1